MGTDKAFCEIDGVALVARVAAALRKAGIDDIVVVGGDRQRQALLGLCHVADQDPGSGPLGGIISALEALDAEIVVILSCDLVSPSETAIEALLEHCTTTRTPADPVVDVAPVDVARVDVVVPCSSGQPQWLHAAWRRDCLPKLQAAFARGIRAPREALEDLEVLSFAVTEPDWFRDADRPEDLPGSNGLASPTTRQAPDTTEQTN